MGAIEPFAKTKLIMGVLSTLPGKKDELRHILVDDSLNDVRLFLPYFNRDTVLEIIDELQSAEGGDKI